METMVPLSKLLQRPTEVAALAATEDVILGRRDAADLFLSTRERHEGEAQGLQIATRALAALARVRPDLAGDALTETLPWMKWLPSEERVKCMQELLDDLRAGADTSQLRPFLLNMAAWKSTAIAWSDPEVAAALTCVDEDEMEYEESLIPRPAG